MTDHWTPGPTEPRLVVLLAVYDSPIVEVGLRAILQSEADLDVRPATSLESLLGLLRGTHPDVVITDCMLTNNAVKEAIEVIETIRETSRQSHVLVLASPANTGHFSLALKAGADGFLTRDALPPDIISAVRCVARGQTYVSPRIITEMMNRYASRGRPRAVEDSYESLTEREREILLLVATGLTNREIAEITHLSEQTVHNNRARLMEKLGFHDRVELLKYAIRRQLIAVEDM